MFHFCGVDREGKQELQEYTQHSQVQGLERDKRKEGDVENLKLARWKEGQLIGHLSCTDRTVNGSTTGGAKEHESLTLYKKTCPQVGSGIWNLSVGIRLYGQCEL